MRTVRDVADQHPCLPLTPAFHSHLLKLWSTACIHEPMECKSHCRSLSVRLCRVLKIHSHEVQGLISPLSVFKIFPNLPSYSCTKRAGIQPCRCFLRHPVLLSPSLHTEKGNITYLLLQLCEI